MSADAGFFWSKQTPIHTDLSFTFNEPIDPSTVSINIIPIAPVPGTPDTGAKPLHFGVQTSPDEFDGYAVNIGIYPSWFNQSTNTLTIPYSAYGFMDNLHSGTRYSVTMSGATDAGGHIMQPQSWNMVTYTSPLVVRAYPQPDSNRIPPGTQEIRLFVNQPVYDAWTMGDSLTGSDGTSLGVDNRTIGGLNNNVVTLHLDQPLAASTTYTFHCQISGPGGNNSVFVMTFTTSGVSVAPTATFAVDDPIASTPPVADPIDQLS